MEILNNDELVPLGCTKSCSCLIRKIIENLKLSGKISCFRTIIPVSFRLQKRYRKVHFIENAISSKAERINSSIFARLNSPFDLIPIIIGNENIPSSFLPTLCGTTYSQEHSI